MTDILAPFFRDIGELFRPALFNVYFAVASIPLGFVLAIGVAVVRHRGHPVWSRLAAGYTSFFRGSPLFIQFFLVYSVVLSLNLSLWQPLGVDRFILHPLFLGPFVLTLNTTAYTSEIFFGALRTVPKGEIDAAHAFGMGRWRTFRSVTWPNVIRVAWPAYTNEVIFLFQATAIVYFTLPLVHGQQELLIRAEELFQRDYNVFLHFGVAALYFVVISLLVFVGFGLIYRRLMRHAGGPVPRWVRYAPKFLR
ncbi:MAG: ABC transporter permease subunit [Bauldia sp.]|nr:ABC transporter permease subunit [Bauldia sp.]MCW5719255.1 ABC transporter permease subunit [Bauldia sp.]